MVTANAISSTTQQFLDIYDIVDNLILLKSGGASLVITVNAINFGLLSEEEQDAIIYSYAGLLNSLNYHIQIVVRSQTKDVTSYLNSLKGKEDETINRIRKEQIRRYREFISNLVQERNVLDKKFYVIIPATGLELGIVTTQSVLPGVKSPDISMFEKSVIVERARNLLEPKRDHLVAQFARIGMSSRQLETQELIQLFYTIYNTEASEGQQMTDSRNYTSAVVDGSLENTNIITSFNTARSLQPENLRPHDVVAAPVEVTTTSPTPPSGNSTAPTTPSQSSQPPQPPSPPAESDFNAQMTQAVFEQQNSSSTSAVNN